MRAVRRATAMTWMTGPGSHLTEFFHSAILMFNLMKRPPYKP